MPLVLLQSVSAADFIQVQTSDGNAATYFVTSRTPIISATNSALEPVTLSEKLTLLITEKDEKYTIARQFTLEVIERASSDSGKKHGSRELILQGITPHGQVSTSALEPVFHTLELKPAGTVLANFCGKNQVKGSRVLEICLSSGDLVEGDN